MCGRCTEAFREFSGVFAADSSTDATDASLGGEEERRILSSSGARSLIWCRSRCDFDAALPIRSDKPIDSVSELLRKAVEVVCLLQLELESSL